eukprot:UN25988
MESEWVYLTIAEVEEILLAEYEAYLINDLEMRYQERRRRFYRLLLDRSKAEPSPSPSSTIQAKVILVDRKKTLFPYDRKVRFVQFMKYQEERKLLKLLRKFDYAYNRKKQEWVKMVTKHHQNS